MNGNQLNTMEATMGAAVDAKMQITALNQPDQAAIREDELYFRNNRPQRQGFLKTSAVVLSCASGALLVCTSFMASKQNSLFGIMVDVLALCAGALVGYHAARQKH